MIFGGMSPLEMRSTYSADTFKGLIRVSNNLLISRMSLPFSPVYLSASARTLNLPAIAALISTSRSWFRKWTTSISALRLFLISLKSPLYVSVILGGMSPLEMRSTYSADTFRGLITASSIPFSPSAMVRSPPWNWSARARSARRPCWRAKTTRSISSCSRFLVSVPGAFLAGRSRTAAPVDGLRSERTRPPSFALAIVIAPLHSYVRYYAVTGAWLLTRCCLSRADKPAAAISRDSRNLSLQRSSSGAP